jgi:hypothetical protein
MVRLPIALFLLSLVFAGCGDDGSDPQRFVRWAERAGGDGWDQARAVAVDPSGAIYVAGRFERSAAFGAGEPGETALEVQGDQVADNRDAFLARLEPNGELTWVVGAGGPGPDEAHSAVVAPDGSIFLAGVFSDGATFGAGGAAETTLAGGAGNTFLARYLSTGELDWARPTAGTWTAAEDLYRVSVVALDDGSAAIKGTIAGSAVFGPGEAGETTLVGTGPRDDFAARYDDEGALVWARHLGGSAGAGGLTALIDGRLAACGDFESAAVLGAGEPNEVELIAEGHRDVYVAVLGADGALAWAERAGSSSLESATGIASLADGSFLVTGFFMHKITFDLEQAGEVKLESSGSDTSFVARYGGDGEVAWAIELGGGGWLDTVGIAVLPGDGFAVTGRIGDIAPAVIGEGTDQEIELEPSGGQDAFLAVFDHQGAPIRALSFGSTGFGYLDDSGFAVAAHGDDSLVVAGSYEGDELVIRADGRKITLPNAGGSDAFFALFCP